MHINKQGITTFFINQLTSKVHIQSYTFDLEEEIWVKEYYNLNSQQP